MTDMTTIQAALRLRAEYLQTEPVRISRADGDMMYEAALYIERLERDKSRLVEEVATGVRERAKLGAAYQATDIALVKACVERDGAIKQRDDAARTLDGEIRARLQHAHDLTAQSEHHFKTLIAITAERDAAQNRATLHAQNCDKARYARDLLRGDLTKVRGLANIALRATGTPYSVVEILRKISWAGAVDIGEAEPVKDACVDRHASTADTDVLRALARHLNRICDASKL